MSLNGCGANAKLTRWHIVVILLSVSTSFSKTFIASYRRRACTPRYIITQSFAINRTGKMGIITVSGNTHNVIVERRRTRSINHGDRFCPNAATTAKSFGGLETRPLNKCRAHNDNSMVPCYDTMDRHIRLKRENCPIVITVKILMADSLGVTVLPLWCFRRVFKAVGDCHRSIFFRCDL